MTMWWLVVLLVALTAAVATLAAIYLPKQANDEIAGITPSHPDAGTPNTSVPEHKTGHRAAAALNARTPHELARLETSLERGHTLHRVDYSYDNTGLYVLVTVKSDAKTYVSLFKRADNHAQWTREYSMVPVRDNAEALISPIDHTLLYEILLNGEAYQIAYDSGSNTMNTTGNFSNGIVIDDHNSIRIHDTNPPHHGQAGIYALASNLKSWVRLTTVGTPGWASVLSDTVSYHQAGDWVATVNEAGTKVTILGDNGSSWVTDANRTWDGLTNVTDAWIARNGMHLWVSYGSSANAQTVLAYTWNSTSTQWDMSHDVTRGANGFIVFPPTYNAVSIWGGRYLHYQHLEYGDKEEVAHTDDTHDADTHVKAGRDVLNAKNRVVHIVYGEGQVVSPTTGMIHVYSKELAV